MTAFTANPTEFIFDLSGKNAAREAAVRSKRGLPRWFTRHVARRQASAMAQVAAIDPQLAQEVWTSQAQTDAK